MLIFSLFMERQMHMTPIKEYVHMYKIIDICIIFIKWNNVWELH